MVGGTGTDTYGRMSETEPPGAELGVLSGGGAYPLRVGAVHPSQIATQGTHDPRPAQRRLTFSNRENVLCWLLRPLMSTLITLLTRGRLV
eukprot:3589111-Pyramimonas_sp.AAC.1